MIRRSLFLVVLLAAGCAAADKYPSLALRPIESRSDDEVVTPVAAATPDAALDAQLGTVSAKLAKIDTDFAAISARADTAAKAPGAQAVGSDQWLAAQSALAEMDGLGGDTLGTVSDLEQMTTARGEAGQPPYPALDALRARAQDQADAETAKVAAIKALLGEK
ncbi:hypothetical protein [Sphingomonas bacterium]|uniref:hypothetical protein n=1 Tax=Sphingomonas bacterium TaxID=1895847 RepID=UPI0026200C6B|nr:hypothetical protein [Sphingomonas bacterium]